MQLWWLTQATLFRGSPQVAYGFRRFLLRVFGASVGKKVLVRPTAKVTYPWKVSIGDFSWIGDDVVLYSLGNIDIGEHSVISQRSYLCAGDHNYKLPNFPIRSRPIKVGNEVWVAADVYVGPGASIGDRCVVGARSSVLTSLPSGMVCVGSPAKALKARVMLNEKYDGASLQCTDPASE